MKLSHKPHSRCEIPPSVSFEISEPCPGDTTPPSPDNSSGLDAPGKWQQTQSVDTKNTVHSPASLPGRRIKADKRSTKSLTSGNSSANSLLVGFEDADTFPTDQDQDNNLPRRIKTSDMRLMAKKRQEIIQIQRLLTHQQEIYISLYAQIKDLEAKCGLDPGNCLGEMRILTMKGWLPHDLLLLVTELPADKQEANGALEWAILEQLTSELSTIPKEVLDMGADLTARRTKVLEYIRKRLPDTKSKNDFDSETEIIHKVIDDTAKRLDARIKRSLELAKTSWRDRDCLFKKIDLLNIELCALQSKFYKNTAGEEERKKMEQVEKLNNEQIKKSDSRISTELREKLNKERAAREAMKHTVATAEAMLRTARARITALERELKLTQKELQASVRKHKEYVTLHRNRVNTYDVRSKKLLEESKTGEVTIEMLSLQRDALEFRVKELQEKNKAVIENYESQQSELQARLERLQDKVEEQVQRAPWRCKGLLLRVVGDLLGLASVQSNVQLLTAVAQLFAAMCVNSGLPRTENEERLKKLADARATDLEKRIKDMQDQYRLLREQSEQIVKINSGKCLDYLPHKENEPSKRETELWTDLQVTKKNLARVMDELKQSREDKESLLNSLAKLAQEGSEKNMAKELLLREQKNFKLQQVIKELKENVKSMMDTIALKDKQLVFLKMEASRINYECCSKDTPQQELALEVIDLTTQVANLTRERESLIKDAMTRSLMLERYERCSELFAHMTRARRNLAAQLEGDSRPDRPCSEGAFHDANLSSSLSSSCLKAAKTWEALRTDRERVLKLQDVVASQNLQLQRECFIRNQLEQRRAVMERMFLNRNQSAPDQYIPPENVAAYFGTSTYFMNNAS